MAVGRDELRTVLDSELRVSAFKDYCPNGLQVEGRDEINVLVSGVTACQALLDRAVALEADAVLVHHGYFWRGEDERLVGMKAKRIRTLLEAGISLFAYHLPLDCHPTLGNNAGLARAMGLQHGRGLILKTQPIPCSAAHSMRGHVYQTSLGGWSMNSNVRLWSLAIPIQSSDRPLGARVAVRVTLMKLRPTVQSYLSRERCQSRRSTWHASKV